MGFTLEQAARMYSVPVVEYPGRELGLLLSSGCGVMLAVMDQVPLRWCADVDRMSDAQRARLPDFMEMAIGGAGLVAVCGWFSHHSPTALREGLLRLGASAPSYAGHVRFDVPGESCTLADFVSAARVALETARASPARAVR